MQQRITRAVDGDIGYYDLSEWFLSAFTEEERSCMVRRYAPMGIARKYPLISGKIGSSTGTVEQFLVGLLSWFRGPQDKSIYYRILDKLHEFTYDKDTGSPKDLSNPTWYVEDIKELKRNGDYQKAYELLLQIVYILENTASSDGRIPPWYHEQLSIVLKKLGYKEQAIRVKQIYDEIVITNFIIESGLLARTPIDIRERYYPNGTVITKKVLESAKRLLKTNPELVKSANLLDKDDQLVKPTPPSLAA